MGLKGVSFLVLLVSISAFAFAESGSQTDSQDCNTLVLNMVDCLSFVSNGSTESKPAKNCCNGLKTVLKANSSCLCEGFKNSAQFGVVLNVTKAMSLPAQCKVSAPSVSDCGLSVTPPDAAPALSPAPASSSPKGHAPATAPTKATTAPAPAPSSSGSSSIAGSLVFLAICLGTLCLSLM